ncbi:AAA family ATPase [Succinivibrio dextrinosolvens]|uniref:PD-(D/E)XK nuclease superfamily protein n=1 Tax=Succinivibrio dextrinosolvens TaxID=83771 RepID=A0A662ZEG2_9GAMM|nr:AAA family ATPase [Succinivibrio dextrinosolvens]SFK55588.1 PD-(D/E)XK nuclease superfamily protein [Succinivibrio dextrinosolvens]
MKKIANSENIEQFMLKDYIYIDKTKYIYNLIDTYERVFFSRPRRFGKSLTLNTIGTLFEKGVEPYFKDTWIYDKWNQSSCPVLRLSFLKFSVSDFDKFNKDFCNEILKFAIANDITDFIDAQDPKILIGNIFSAMPEGMQIVLLIDEYDCQLTANINNQELYEKFRIFIREFYAVLKGEKHIRFMALTGVTRLKDVSIFSVGSDIKDLSYEHSFSQMIGFTREEIKKFYIDYLKLGISYEKHIETGAVTDTDVEEFLDRMAEHYDSYCFDEFYENKVFSTYSVNNFLQSIFSKQRVIFGEYWYEAGGIPSILKNYMEAHDIDLKKFQFSKIEVAYDDFVNPTSLPDMNENVLMSQTGYLTLKSDINPNRSKLLLGFANREVSTALCRLLGLKLFSKTVEIVTYNNVNLLETSSTEELIDLFNSVLASVVYDRNSVIHDESSLRAIIQVFMMGKGVDVRAEQHNFKGRSDILLNLNKRRIVLELKYSDDGHDVNSLLEGAINQIKEKEYGIENLGDRELIQIAAVFDGTREVRKITVFKQIKPRINIKVTL